MKSRVAYFVEKLPLGRAYLHWYHRSFANRLTMLSLTLSLCGIVFVGVASLAIVFSIVQEKEREIVAKDLSVGATRLTVALQAINQQVSDLARNAALVNVSFIDDYQISQLHDAFFNGLQIIACIGQLHQHKHISHACHRGFALTHTNGFHNDDVITRRFTHQHAFTGFLSHTA